MPLAARGHTLVEVLVALVVVAVGLLGLASLLVGGLGAVRTAGTDTQAALLAGDLIERLLANRAAAAAYDTAAGAAHARLDPACEAAGCAPAVLAGHDLRQWLDTVADELPAGSGRVEVAPLPDGRLRCAVEVSWRALTADAPGSFQLVAEL
jgi:type IV pilus assembly protein PilV